MMRPLAALILLTGCSPDARLGDLAILDGAGPHTPSQSIVNGYAPDAPEHEATVALHQLSSDGTSVYVSPFCSGTLIAEDVVLTAAHCLDVARGGGSFRTMPPNRLAIYIGDEPAVDILDHLYAVSETLIHPDYDRRRLTGDIALVRLSTGIVEPVAPVPGLPSASGFSNADVGMAINFAGFGETETGSSGVKLQADNVLGGLGCSVFGCPSAGDSATQVSYDQRSGSGGPCFGDSGGPMFVERSGSAYVAGITSYGDAYCETYGVSTRVDAFEGWIGDFTGTGPGDTGGSDTGGSDTGGSDTGAADFCGDGICGTGESCDGRDGTLECASDCDGKTNGKPSGRYCYVEGSCEGEGC